MKLLKSFILFSMFFVFCSLVVKGQNLAPLSNEISFLEDDDMQEIEVLYNENTNQNYFIPIEDESGEPIKRYTVTARNDIGDIVDSYKTLVDDLQPVILYNVSNTNPLVESDFLTIVAAVDPTIILTNSTTAYDITSDLRFETHRGIQYFYNYIPLGQEYPSNNYTTLSSCLEQIANQENIIVTDIAISLSENPNIQDCQNGEESISKNGWHFNVEQENGFYFYNGNRINYTYNTIETSYASLSQTMPFDIGYKIEISYHRNNGNNAKVSHMKRCSFQTLHCRRGKGAFKTQFNSDQLDFKVFPNPCQNYTNIAYTLAEDSKVNIVVYNIRGEKVAYINNKEYQVAGEHRAEIDMSHLANGTYICSVSQSNGEVASQRFVKMQ